eukprot:g27273.t1
MAVHAGRKLLLLLQKRGAQEAKVDVSGFGILSDDANECQSLTDEGVEYLSNMAVRNLKALNLTNCKAITKEGVRHLIKAKKLESLILTGCDKVEPQDIKFFLAYCKLESCTVTQGDQTFEYERPTAQQPHRSGHIPERHYL